MLIILEIALGLMGLLLLIKGGGWIFSLKKMMAGTGILRLEEITLSANSWKYRTAVTKTRSQLA